MNCTDVEAVVRDAWDFARDDGEAAAVASLLVLSGLLLCFGERLIKPTAFLAGGIAGGAGLYWALARVECDARLALSGVGALVLAGASLCAVKTSVALVAGAGAAAAAYYTYHALSVDAGFQLFGTDGAHVLITAGGGVVGLCSACCFGRTLLRVVSAATAGLGFAAALHLLAGDGVPLVAHAGVVGGSALVGVAAQRHLARRND